MKFCPRIETSCCSTSWNPRLSKNGSSAKSVGELRLGQSAKFMIEHDFDRSVSSKAVGLSETRFQAVVQTLYGTEGHLSARLEPVENERLMSAQHARDLLHRLQTRAQRLRAPLIHEFRRPGRRDVFPEELEFLLEQVGANGAKIAPQQLVELDRLASGQVLGTLQQTPARMGEDDLLAAQAAAGADLARLLRPPARRSRSGKAATCPSR